MPDLAHNDSFVTVEQVNINGNLLSDNGSGADENIDGGTIRIATVNGQTGFGTINLPSGAVLRVEQSGGFSYSFGQIFNSLAGPDSGASNTFFVEQFTYTLEGGSSATVTIRINGLDSTDDVKGTSGNDILFGGIQGDLVFGYAGNDQLNGGTGVDTMWGGPGDDFYYVDVAGDAAIENSGEGFDVVWSSVSYSLRSGSSVEALSTSSWEATTAINLNGNSIGNDIYGNAGANKLDGEEGVDSLFGFGGNDQLTGGTGNDFMYGGTGDDWYFIDALGDKTFENAGQGYDVAWTTVSYALGAGSEVEVLSSRFWETIDAIILVGSDISNTIYANAGNNVLNGRGGSDSLFGFAGEDSFLFDSALGAGNIDYIADFSSADDTIVLDRAVFSTLSFGTIAPSAFFVGSAAHDADDRIIYDSSTGALYYDADGNGAGAAVQFATLLGTPAISSIDFFAI